MHFGHLEKTKIRKFGAQKKIMQKDYQHYACWYSILHSFLSLEGQDVTPQDK